MCFFLLPCKSSFLWMRAGPSVRGTMAPKDIMVHLGPCQGELFLPVHFHLSWRLISQAAFFLLCCSQICERVFRLRMVGIQAELILLGAFTFPPFPFWRILGVRPDSARCETISKEFTDKMNMWQQLPRFFFSPFSLTKWRSRLQPIFTFTLPFFKPISLWSEQISKSLSSRSTGAFYYMSIQDCNTTI